jgi:hypothetical protein
MKKQIEFNHDTDKLTSAFGTTTEKISSQITKATKMFMNDDRSKVSVLGEILHNEVDYNVILLLATEQVEYIAMKNAKVVMERLIKKLEEEN